MAQTKVTGTVVGFEDNEPIIGATIQAVGNASIGTITDYDGNFTLDVPEGVKTLKITYVGMEPLEVAVSTKALKIQLKNDSQILDEVVVVAYGTQKKTSLTGSIQEVKSEAIEMRPTSSAAAALEGTVTGVQVNSTYGAPGSDPQSAYAVWERLTVAARLSIFLTACLTTETSATLTLRISSRCRY